MERTSFRRTGLLIAILMLVFGLPGYFTPVHAQEISAASRCGDGYAPDYGFTYDLAQAHWTVGWEGHASEWTVSEVDTVLDRLDEESIAQTMILILPQEQVGIRTNCAVHFLRYMQLGLPTGARKDNGLVFLIVVEPDSIDVHYAVGLGLPALTARELTNINRAVEATYQTTQSMDQALLTLADEFNTVARSNYAPVTASAPTPESVDRPIGSVGALALGGQLCLGFLMFLFIVWMFSQMGGGSSFQPPGSSPWGRDFRGFPTGGGRSSPGPRMRRGSGSGRSGRTN